jgi:hypothetical protein
MKLGTLIRMLHPRGENASIPAWYSLGGPMRAVFAEPRVKVNRVQRTWCANCDRRRLTIGTVRVCEPCHIKKRKHNP